MDSKNNKAVEIGKAYGALTRALTEQANAERIRVAQANFNASRTQIEAQRNQRSADLSRTFQKHIGAVQANAAFRGVGGGSVAALIGEVTAEGEVARRNIDINANNAIGAEAAQAVVPIEDPALAQLEGTFRGLGIGSDFVEALDQLEPTRGTRTDWVRTGIGWQAVRRTTETPQNFDLRQMYPELDDFLRGN
jgi:hypothetical protein